jgi:hypothetical protein
LVIRTMPLRGSATKSFDLLATLVAVVGPTAWSLFLMPRWKTPLGFRGEAWGHALADTFTEPSLLRECLAWRAQDNAFAVLRYDAFLKRMGAS